MTDPQELEWQDPLAAYRQRFVGVDGPLVYFDGNSLGRPPKSAIARVEEFLRESWGGRLIRGWDESWLRLPNEIGDRIGRAVIDAKAGQTVIGDSTTVLLYKLARAAVDAQVARDGGLQRQQREDRLVDLEVAPVDAVVVDDHHPGELDVLMRDGLDRPVQRRHDDVETAERPRLELGVSPRLERGRHAEPGARSDLAHLQRRLEDLRPVLGPELGDHPAPALGVCLVPEREVSIRQLLCRPGPGLGGRNCFAHLGCLL